MSEQDVAGSRWGDPISEERQAELHDYLDRWEIETEHDERKGPFDKVILTGAEVGWLAAHSLSLAGHISLADAAAQLLEVTRVRMNSIQHESAIGSAYWIHDLPLLNLEGAILRGAYLAGASLTLANLSAADLQGAHLEGAILRETHLEKANLSGANLDDVNASGIYLRQAILYSASMKRIDLSAWNKPSHLEKAMLSKASLESARLDGAYCQGAYFNSAQLSLATFRGAHLNQANFVNAILKGADLSDAFLEGANLSNAWIDRASNLNDAWLDGTILDQIRLDGTNLAVVDWSMVKHLGDEIIAHSSIDSMGKSKDQQVRQHEYEAAVRAHLQLSAAMRRQGMSEQADRFAYRAQVCHLKVLRLQGIQKLPEYGWSCILWLTAGYGYRIWRIFTTYVGVLVLFTLAYWAFGVHSHTGEPGIEALWDSFLVSLSAIHGRTLFEQLGAWSSAAWVAAIESVIGIVIEGIFVAMLIQRFFAR